MLTQYTKRKVYAKQQTAGTRVSRFSALVVCAFLLGGCASLGDFGGGFGGGSGAGRDSSSGGGSAANKTGDGVGESTIAFAQLPNTRPDVKVQPRSAELFAQSLQALENSDFPRAESLLLRITNLQPELSGPWLNLGQVLLAGGRTGSARTAFERSIMANPTNCAAFNQLGVLARTEGRLNEAESSYLACIERNPTFPQVYLNLGILYEVYLGKLPQALKAYREYQDLTAATGAEDSRVKGWVIDLERRL